MLHPRPRFRPLVLHMYLCAKGGKGDQFLYASRATKNAALQHFHDEKAAVGAGHCVLAKRNEKKQ